MSLRLARHAAAALLATGLMAPDGGVVAGRVPVGRASSSAADPARLPAAAAIVPLAVIVNRSNPIDSIGKAELRTLFLGGRTTWPHGRRVTLVLREPGQPERAAALRLIYGMSEDDMTRHFIHQTFSGSAAGGPPAMATPEGVKRFVFNVPGEPGAGSTFWFELALPTATATQSASTPSSLPAPTAPACGIALDVLLAEDNPVNTAVAMAMLKRDGHKVTVAENGLAVLAALDWQAFDVVLMDCHMPEMDGFEATTQLRARGNRVRVIALTASARDDERAHCFAVGMDDVLSKPLTAKNLRDALQRAQAERDAAA